MILDEYGLEIGNDDRPTSHWARSGEEGELTIELTLAARLITRLTILEGSHTAGSDHKVIKWEFIVYMQEEGDHPQVIG
jgi:hypothetical protein